MLVQLFASTGSTSAANETPSPEHSQLPITHVPPSPHALSQAPQWLGSICVSTQAPSHSVRPPQSSVQAPIEQTWLGVQALPQPPQSCGSVCVSTQAPSHSSWPLGHTQLPALQGTPSGQGLSQLPQCRGSFSRSTQASPPHVSQLMPSRFAIHICTQACCSNGSAPV